MTESEWLASEDPAAMLAFVTTRSAHVGHPGMPYISDRKLRLFACAVARQMWHLLTDPRSREGVVVAERFADGKATPHELADASTAVQEVGNKDWAAYPALTTNEGNGVVVAFQSCWRVSERAAQLPPPATQAALLRDIIGNPFRPVRWPNVNFQAFKNATRAPRSRCGVCGYVAASVAEEESHRKKCCPWLTPQVLSLAQAAYEDRPGPRWECVVHGTVPEAEVYEAEGGGHGHYLEINDCWREARLVEDGALDSLTLLALADALEEAGCPTDVTEKCQFKTGFACPKCGDHGFWRSGQEFDHMKKCRRDECGFVWVPEEVIVKEVQSPHPLLAHLRSPGPHVRGCHAVDLLLGKE